MIRCVVYDDQKKIVNDQWESLNQPMLAEKADLLTSDIQEVLNWARIPRPDYTIYYIFLNTNAHELIQKIRLCQTLQRLDHHGYVIFVSAWPQYALNCCKVHAFDFLVAPFSKEDFLDAVEAIQYDISRREEGTPLIIKNAGHIYRLNQNSILYFSRDRDHLHATTLSGLFRWRESFVSLLDRLSPEFFCRTHNGYIVNLNYVSGVDTNEKMIRMSNGADIPYSRGNEQRFLRALSEHLADHSLFFGKEHPHDDQLVSG